VTNYAVILSGAYEDAVAGARQLQAAIQSLTEKPSEQTITAARRAWLEARIPYLQTEVARFYDGPIDELEGMVNAWPIDESYIDYVAGDPNAGIINLSSNYPSLSEKALLSLNEKEGEKNISVGFHALEFLLWGQDFATNGPGNRPWTDYGSGGRNAERRRQYVRLAAKLLVEHLQAVAAAWSDQGPTNYRAAFLAQDSDESLARILKGMGMLSGPELAGERLTVPYETKEQEEEHSCFSDNTHNDVIYDALGIQNVYLGRHVSPRGRTLGGPGIHHLLQRADPEFAAALAAQFETSVRLARKIPPPFDQAIRGPSGSPARLAIKETIGSLQAQSAMIARAAKLLGVKLQL
jgi:putative iron-regulated protein